jgi:hypothetical protein
LGASSDGYPCTRERPILANPFARRMYNWSDAREGWEGRHAFVWCDFHRVGDGFGVFF